MPGSVLANRYRIVSLLGRGGMGEVYRAEDTKLGVAVALKFLPVELPESLDRFFREVRLGRQISHPNVCRIYDVVEADGLHFLSMEYVDGEDLASLLKRIGRLPPDKAMEVLRQVCAGLDAVHAKGVLHQDLKPANVMIDGRGQARIADFGLAIPTAEGGQPTLAGTPTYMAPEQLAGKGASVRSDLYALGLVAYEMFTGSRLFDGRSLAELKTQHEQRPSVRIRSLVAEIDARVEAVVLQCLDEDPEKRPASVRQVLAALPGGDPLQAAIDAGETPAPELVAAARTVGDLPAGRAWAAVLALVAGVLVAVVLSGQTMLYRLVPLDKPREVLAERARQVMAKAGHREPRSDSASWFAPNPDYVRYLVAHDPSPTRFHRLRKAAGSGVLFRYRQSRLPLQPASRWVGWSDPPLTVPGMANVALRSDGILDGYYAVPPEVDDSAGPWPEPAWGGLLAEAGLDPAVLSEARPMWTPQLATDARRAWTIPGADPLESPMRVEAGSYRGRPVFFRVFWAWDLPAVETAQSPGSVFNRLARVGFYSIANAVALVGAVLLARWNLRVGRGDRKGAWRVSLVYFGLNIASRLVGMHHPPSVDGEWEILQMQLAEALFEAARVWVFYVALEPFARRRWPHVLIAWNRVIAGRFGDPLVGRDLLLGGLCGTFMFLLWQMGTLSPSWFDGAPLAPFTHIRGLDGARDFVSEALGLLVHVVGMALVHLFVLVLYRMFLRNDRLAFGLMVLNNVVFNLWMYSGEKPLLEFAFLALVWGVGVFVLVRLGLLALMGALLFYEGLRVLPASLDLGATYAGQSLATLALLLAAAAYGFGVSLGGKPALGRVLDA